MDQSVKLVRATTADRAALTRLKHQMNLSEFYWRTVANDSGAADLDLSSDAANGPVDRDLAVLESGAGGILLALVKDTPVGYISYAVKESSTSFRQEARKYLYVSGLAVDEEHRNSGIGSVLLDAVEGEAKLRGLNKVMLDVSNVSPAVRFYQRAGFVPVSQTIIKRFC